VINVNGSNLTCCTFVITNTISAKSGFPFSNARAVSDRVRTFTTFYVAAFGRGRCSSR
jgi:hypothetical protein